MPLSWVAVFIVIMFVAVNAASAHAEPAGAQRGVCQLLDTHPTIGGMIDALDQLRAGGLSAREAGTALIDAVVDECPRHAGLLQQAIARGEERAA